MAPSRRLGEDRSGLTMVTCGVSYDVSKDAFVSAAKRIKIRRVNRDIMDNTLPNMILLLTCSYLHRDCSRTRGTLCLWSDPF